MSDVSALKRPLLYLLAGSVVIGAALGIFLVLRGQWGWIEVRVILTTITLAVASLCGLACDHSRVARGWNVLPRLGLTLTLLATVAILGIIWLDDTLDEDWFVKTAVCLAVWAVATVHVCLLSIVWLAPRFRWVFFLAQQVIFGLAALISAMLIWEIEGARMFQFVAVVSILDAALTLLIPLLHRISRTERSGESAQVTRVNQLPPVDQRNVQALNQEIADLQKRLRQLEKLRSEIIGTADSLAPAHDGTPRPA
jgi:hypothetical protein